MSAGSRPVAGFALMAALVMVAITAASSLAVLRYNAMQQQREREGWLLFVGGEYRRALERYVRAGVGEPGRGPRELEDLLIDRRGSAPLHHLRRLYPDPMTGQVDWIALRDAGGFITGIHSSSTRAPLRRNGFSAQEKNFGRAGAYRDWLFRPAADADGGLGQNAPTDDAGDEPMQGLNPDP